MSADQRANLERAAALLGKTKSQFVADAVQHAVAEAYRHIQMIELDREATVSFLMMLDDATPAEAQTLERFRNAPTAEHR